MDERSVFFCLIIGVFFGFLLLINYRLSKKYKKRKFFLFIADFTFSFMLVVVSYIGSLPLTYGRVRLLQVLLEITAMLSVFYAFEPLINLVSKLKDKLKTKFNKNNQM